MSCFFFDQKRERVEHRASGRDNVRAPQTSVMMTENKSLQDLTGLEKQPKTWNSEVNTETESNRPQKI
jgi:hypothetical protein